MPCGRSLLGRLAVMDGNARHLPLVLGAVAMPPLAVVSPQAITILGAIVAGWALIDMVRGGGRPGWAREPLPWVLALLLVWCALSASWSVVPVQSLRLVAPIFFVFLGVLVLLGLADGLEASARRRVARFWLAGFAIAAAILALDFSFGFPLARLLAGAGPESPAERLTKNYDAAVIVLLMSAWPLVLAGGNRWTRWLPLAAAAVLVLSAANLTAKVALVLAAGAYVLARWRARPVILGVAAACILAVLAAPVIFAAADPDGPWAGRVEQVRESGLHRLHTWNFVAGRIAERPWLGWGLDSSPAIPGGDAEVRSGWPYLSLHPHNIGLQLWLELGVVGAVLGAAVLALIGRGLLGLDPAKSAVGVALLVTVFTAASLSYGMWQNWWLAAQGITAALFWSQAAEHPRPEPGRRPWWPPWLSG